MMNFGSREGKALSEIHLNERVDFVVKREFFVLKCHTQNRKRAYLQEGFSKTHECVIKVMIMITIEIRMTMTITTTSTSVDDDKFHRRRKLRDQDPFLSEIW